MDLLPTYSSMINERCTLQKLNSSDDDSELSSLPWDETLEELDAFLHENPPGWVSKCECTDNKFSLCSFCLSHYENFLSLLPIGESNREDLPYDDIQDPNSLVVDRLYPDSKENSRDDLVVLGVGLQALSSAIFCDVPQDPHSGTTINSPYQNMNRPVGGQSSEYGRVLTTNNKQSSYSFTSRQQSVDWCFQQQQTSVSVDYAVKPAAKQPAQRTRRQGGNRRTVPEEDKIFACPYDGCVRVYSKNSHLRAHLRRHTGEKPFVCQWPGCKWRFSRSDELARHKRSHSGIKPYQCTVCGKRFGRSDHLAKHVRIHRKQGVIVPQKPNGKSSVKVEVLNSYK